MPTKDEKLNAVNSTLEKWIKCNEMRKSFFSEAFEPCGFCEVYNCIGVSECPAKTQCSETFTDLHDAEKKILERINKNLRWLRKQKKNIEGLK